MIFLCVFFAKNLQFVTKKLPDFSESPKLKQTKTFSHCLNAGILLV